MKSNRGVALLATVLVVALATILIAGLLDRGMIGLARSLQHTRAAQAVAFQQGLELWAARILRDDEEALPSVDSRTDVWAQPMPPITVPEGMIHGTLRDLDGCLNLNSLATAGNGDIVTLQETRFRRLFGVLEVDEGIVAAIVDWVDADGAARGSGGGEDSRYATLDPPRRTGNRPFVHVSELRAVAGVTPDIYARLLPHVCARPIQGQRAANAINVNTASAEVLMSLHEGIGAALAQRMYQDGRARWNNAGEFTRVLEEAAVAPPYELADITFGSRYFVAEADLLIGEVPVRLYSVLERRENNQIVVTARSQGRF